VPSGLVNTSTSPASVFQRVGDFGIDQAGDGKAEFNFVVLDAVPADERDASLFKNIHPRGQHLIHHLAR